jgi:hypothetical protein
VSVKQFGQVGKFQNAVHMLGDAAELKVAPHLARTGEAADEGAEAAAIDEFDIAQVQHKAAAVAQQPANVLAEGFVFFAGDNAPVTAHHRDPSNLTSVER